MDQATVKTLSDAAYFAAVNALDVAGTTYEEASAALADAAARLTTLASFGTKAAAT